MKKIQPDADCLEAKAFLEAAFSALWQVFWMAEKHKRYGSCRACGGPLSGMQYEYAMRKMSAETCSLACMRREHFLWYACCDKAAHRPCVCRASFDCSVHGRTCIGTHD